MSLFLAQDGDLSSWVLEIPKAEALASSDHAGQELKGSSLAIGEGAAELPIDEYLFGEIAEWSEG